ncbi:hypothetical protein PAMP_023389 [Pampus punctatissimus]
MQTLLLLCVAVLSVLGTAEQKLKNCNEVRAAYSSKGFNVNDVPNKGVIVRLDVMLQVWDRSKRRAAGTSHAQNQLSCIMTETQSVHDLSTSAS